MGPIHKYNYIKFNGTNTKIQLQNQERGLKSMFYKNFNLDTENHEILSYTIIKDYTFPILILSFILLLMIQSMFNFSVNYHSPITF